MVAGSSNLVCEFVRAVLCRARGGAVMAAMNYIDDNVTAAETGLLYVNGRLYGEGNK